MFYFYLLKNENLFRRLYPKPTIIQKTLSKLDKPLQTNSSAKTILKVLTYSSFAGVYGPGRTIKEQFERVCQCQLKWFLTEDSTALWQRFSILSKIDIVLGWDQITLSAVQNQPWENLHFLKQFVQFEDSPFLKNPYFIPLDWSPIGFLYKGKGPSVSSLKSLPKIKGSISFPEPRASSLGLQFYYWIYEVFKGDKRQIASFLKQLKDKVYGPVFSWSLAYGFFKKGQTDMGLSYLSSLLYHQKQEKDQNYIFANFTEGQAYQLEFFSLSKKSKNKDLAIQFAKFLLSKKIQKLLLDTHYMFPVSRTLPSHSLLNSSSLKLISYQKLDEFIKHKKELLHLWEETTH